MKAEITDSDALAAIEPSAVRAYLDAHGWHHLEAYGQHGEVYGLDKAPEIVAPTSQALRDYPRRIAEIVGILAAVEDRDALRVYRDLTTATSDLIRVRAPEAEEDGSVSIERGVALVTESRNLLLAAACASVRPAALFRAGAIEEAMDCLQNVQMGQTERGSFIVTMLSRVPFDLTPRTPDLLGHLVPSEVDVPFARQVTSKLVRSLHALKDALADIDKGAGIEAFRNRVPLGISANLCDATSKLAVAGEGIDVSLSWALTRPADAHSASASRAVFSKQQAATLQEAARELRSREPRPDERLQGVIGQLIAATETHRERVTLMTVIDGVPTSVSIHTDPENHDAFVDAYRDLHDVIVEGELIRTGQRWTLRDPRNVFVLRTDSGDIGASEDDLVDRAG